MLMYCVYTRTTHLGVVGHTPLSARRAPRICPVRQFVQRFHTAILQQIHTIILPKNVTRKLITEE